MYRTHESVLHPKHVDLPTEIQYNKLNKSHLVGQLLNSISKQLPSAQTLKMDVASCSKTMVTIYQITWYHIAKDSVRSFVIMKNFCEKNVQFITTV